MTCIIGLVCNDEVLIAGDSAAVSTPYHFISPNDDPKVFKNNKFIMGCTTSFRMIQILQHSLVIPKYFEEMDFREYIVTLFIDKVRKAFKEAGFSTKKDEVEKGGTFMVGYKNNLAEIQDDYSYQISSRGESAIGSGYVSALSSLFSTTGKDAKERLMIAMQATERLNITVRRPFHVISSKTLLVEELGSSVK